MTTAPHLATLLLAAAALAACDQPPRPVAGAGENAEVRAAIEAANQATAEAVGRGDAEGIVRHYADDALLLPAGAEAVSGPGAIREHFQRALDAGLKGLKLEVRSLEVAGDLAVETGDYEASGAGGGRLDYGKYVATWRRQDGEWKVYRDISTTSMPAGISTPETTGPLPANCRADGPSAPAAES